VANEIEKQEFSYILSKQAYPNMSEGHLWFSIFSRPPSNKFSRVQRCTCCFVFFFISMLLNIMYYDLFQRLKSRHQQPIITDEKKKSKLTLPWWCIFLAYGLCLLLVGLSVFFIIVRGIELGDLKTQQWLTSILAGFFSSLLLTQPMKVRVDSFINF
jgi:succinate dehydrogenase/fumarate reductase cytochrome b subunit